MDGPKKGLIDSSEKGTGGRFVKHLFIKIIVGDTGIGDMLWEKEDAKVFELEQATLILLYKSKSHPSLLFG